MTQAHRRKARHSGPASGTGHRCIHCKKNKTSTRDRDRLTAGPQFLPPSHSQRADNQNSIEQDEIIPVHLIQSIDASREPRARTGIRIQSKRFRGCRRPRLPAFQENSNPDDKKNRHNSGSPCNDYMGHILCYRGKQDSHTRDHSREHFSPAVRADGSPITWLKV